MKNVRTIFLKEWRGYFNSPVAYIVLIAWLVLSGWFFMSGLFLSGEATIDGFFNFAPLFFLFLIPAVSMRLLAEEERLGTSEILATAPLKDWEIITGKYLAALALIGLGIVCTLIYPISVSFIGPLDWGIVASSYLGLILLAAGFSAIGVFASSLTKSQVVAFIISAILCFALFMLGKVLVAIPTAFVGIVQYLSIDYHLNSLGRGVVDSRAVLYFLSMIGFFLSFAFYAYRRTKHRALSATAIGTILGITIVVNFLSYHIFTRFDWTDGNIYSLSRASVKMIRGLEDPIIIRAYMTKKLPFPYNVKARYTNDLLSEYRAKSRGKLSLKLIDPLDREIKMEAQRAGIPPLQITEIKEGEYGIKEGYMGISILYGDKRGVIPIIENTATLEYDISSRIKRLTAEEKKHIVFTNGHLEIEPNERVIQKMREQYEISQVNPDTQDIPLDATSLVILGPKTEFGDTAIKRIHKALEGGKTCAFFLDKIDVNLDRFVGRKVQTGLEGLLKSYGIEFKDGLVLDMQNQVVGITMQRGSFMMQNFIPYPFFPKASNFNKESPIVRELESMVFPFVSPVSGGTPIVQSSKRSWLTQNIFALSPMEQHLPQPTDEKGPFNLAVTIDSPSRFIVSGCARFAEGRYTSPPNLAFFLNTIDWLAQDESLIGIRSKGVSERPLKPVGKGIKRTIKWLDILLPSVLLIVVGLIRWRKRGKRVYEI
ncbi:Gldg family protein [candidate division WOR-3 bacterium]|nr:Gldg family protein [candidate division WOR-3 bacterium]